MSLRCWPLIVAAFPLLALWATGNVDARQTRADSAYYRYFAQESSGAEGESEPFEAEEREEGEEEEEEEEIETDRDSFTPSTATAGRGRLIFESAWTFIDNRDVAETHSLPEIVARYGVSDVIELRLGWNYEIGGTGNPASGNIPNLREGESELEEESSLLYGAKILLTEQCCHRPQSSLIIHGYTPTSGESRDSRLSIFHVFGWTLPNGWVWDTGNRWATGINEEDHFGVWSPSTVIKVPVGERWKAHLEYFGVFTDGRETETAQHFISPGAHFLVTPRCEIGARFGWGLNDQSPEFFSNFGIGLLY